MSNVATETMLRAVSVIKENAERAEREFDTKADALKRRTRSSIDLFGGHAVSTVADIASESKRMCDSLYSSYQTYVKMLDSQCRPLLDQEPEYSAIRKVRDLIKWLNDESEIENDFTASLNNRSLGDVASARYLPQIENKMIQNFWETTYDMLPGRDEVERKEREQKFLENADKLVQRKEELERKNREAKERFERESSEYDEKYRAWKKEADATKKKRSEKIKSALDEAKRSRISEIEDKHAASLDTITTEIDYWAKEKSDAEAKLAKLGFFKFGEKKATARSIEKMSSRISELEVALVNENNTYALDKGSVEEWLNDQKILIESDVEEMYPIPPQPVKPTAPGTFGATGVGILEAQKAISLYMQPGHLYTISDIHKGVAELANMSAVRVSAIMRQMIGIQLERIEVKRIAYFKLKE